MSKTYYQELEDGELVECEHCNEVHHIAYYVDHLHTMHGHNEDYASAIADTTDPIEAFLCRMCAREIRPQEKSVPRPALSYHGKPGYPDAHFCCSVLQ